MVFVIRARGKSAVFLVQENAGGQFKSVGKLATVEGLAVFSDLAVGDAADLHGAAGGVADAVAVAAGAGTAGFNEPDGVEEAGGNAVTGGNVSQRLVGGSGLSRKAGDAGAEGFLETDQEVIVQTAEVGEVESGSSAGLTRNLELVATGGGEFGFGGSFGEFRGVALGKEALDDRLGTDHQNVVNVFNKGGFSKDGDLAGSVATNSRGSATIIKFSCKLTGSLGTVEDGAGTTGLSETVNFGIIGDAAG